MLSRFKAIFFLIVFLFSISVFWAEVHYCKGKVTEISMFQKASCSCPKMNETKKKCHAKKKKKCCETKVFEHDSEEDFDISKAPVETVKFVTLVSFFFPELILNISEGTETEIPEYSPPDYYCDRNILFRTFLI